MQSRDIVTTLPEKCAINFYGLPRAFGALVLPSVLQNVIRTNKDHRCDYFVHFYNQTEEAAGRSGSGGKIHADDILGLRHAVHQEYANAGLELPVVKFSSDTNESFHQYHQKLMEEVLTRKDETGERPLYLPWMEKDYQFPGTIVNIFKMMHSIHQAWNLMEAHGRTNGINYTRVAMLRADVVFLSPIDLRDSGVTKRIEDSENNWVVIPSFARYPVCDRAIYGNAQGVRQWATGRFKGLSQHVEYFRGSGYVMHNERFVDTTLLASIRQSGIQVLEHPSLCFCRARADNRVWFNDCTKGDASSELKKMFPNDASLISAVERAVQTNCSQVRKEGTTNTRSIWCGEGPQP